ncbi:Metallo-dependent phosphatase-like protein [Rhodocollybia butyracea]|uniref:Serine/threonine-protein phosphatase n=1 Tax=Rhodocollybia butyracea TaxID=206335 RepID=A0A9P5U819_9AGAR|nr:Metallo-dependent phosphatase-like protein [Rhodocollybia butyracea]
MDAQNSEDANLPGSFPVQQVPERYVLNVDPPASNELTDEEFFKGEFVNHALLKDHFFKEGRLKEEHAIFILENAYEMLKQEANLVHVTSPVTICGDIHGQYYDLMKLFEVGGSLNDNCYLFLGDYVDRGSFGIECLLYLYALKLCYPTKFVLLRGNHECRHLTEYFTFKRECLHKYSARVYEACIQSFCALPVAALVDRKFFCVHGGISPELNTLTDIINMDRFREPGSHGLLCDLLWADPVAGFGEEDKPNSLVPKGSTFLHNATRGCSYFYTYAAACQFLERTHLLGIIRGHEAQDNGYTMFRKTPTKKFPSVITIFSAPNYLDVYHNRGAVIKYANKNITIRQYNASPHPYWLPNFMDAFTWSLPFVGAKITEMLLAILSICSEEELTEEDSSEEEGRTLDATVSAADYQQRRQQIKSKIMAVGRMQRVFQLLREESEAASELVATEDAAGPMTSGMRVGPDALSVQGTQIGRNIRSFDDARRSDLMNERLPIFEPDSSPTAPSPTAMFPPPSMRVPGRRSTSGEGLNMEMLIKRTLEEEGDDTGIVERLADKIARGRRPTGRPQPLKRFETT